MSKNHFKLHFPGLKYQLFIRIPVLAIFLITAEISEAQHG